MRDPKPLTCLALPLRLCQVASAGSSRHGRQVQVRSGPGRIPMAEICSRTATVLRHRGQGTRCGRPTRPSTRGGGVGVGMVLDHTGDRGGLDLRVVDPATARAAAHEAHAAGVPGMMLIAAGHPGDDARWLPHVPPGKPLRLRMLLDPPPERANRHDRMPGSDRGAGGARCAEPARRPSDPWSLQRVRFRVLNAPVQVCRRPTDQG